MSSSLTPAKVAIATAAIAHIMYARQVQYDGQAADDQGVEP